MMNLDSIERNLLVVDADEGTDILRGLSSPVRIGILRLLHRCGPLNVNEITHALDLPQSTVANNVQLLEKLKLIQTEAVKANNGHQKICTARFQEIVIRFNDNSRPVTDNVIEVAMPLGLYTSCSVTAPCGLCSSEGVIGLLDVPAYFLDPTRMRAALIWFERGYVEYKFPNNAKLSGSTLEALEFSMELSSEVPGTNVDWPSDISLWVNGTEIGTWTSPGDFGDKRGTYTPKWWKLEGSQYGTLKTWRVTDEGCFIDGRRVSEVRLADLGLNDHHSIKLRIGIADDARRPGGINIFGKGFGNHDQDIVMRLFLAP
jgi:predicted transcriptional regulator